MLRECSLGMTSEWPRVHGLMSMKESVLSSSSILCDGISPLTILQKMQSGSFMRECRLQPLDAAEIAPEPDRDQEHRDHGGRIAEVVAQLRHVAEVHAVDARDQRRHRQ